MATELDKAKWELERLRQQLSDLRAELVSRREESKLDIRRDMLLVIGEVLRLTRQPKATPQDLIRDVEAGLSIALRAGGAEEVGRTGDTVEYNFRFHKSEKEVLPGTLVSIVVPGVVFRNEILGDAVLLKAQVIPS